MLRYAIPGLGNVWQLVLKDSALVSVIGLVELMREAQVGAGSTREPFIFFCAAAALYLIIAAATRRAVPQSRSATPARLQDGLMDIAFLADTMLQLLRGAPLTLELAATSVGLGFVLALALALALQSGPAAVALADPRLRRDVSRHAAARADLSHLLWPRAVSPDLAGARPVGLLPRSPTGAPFSR